MPMIWTRISEAIGNTSVMPQVSGLTVRAAMTTGPFLIVVALLPMALWTVDG